MSQQQYVQVATIAGSDSGGGAGIQADLKTFQARHVFGTAIQVAATAQNTQGVIASFPLPVDFIDTEFQALADDLAIRAVKTGMLYDAAHVQAVVANLTRYDLGPLVVDPVMVAKGGAHLLADDGIQAVIEALLPLATVVTPNLPEAETIVGRALTTPAEIIAAAEEIQHLGGNNVNIKGGHGTEPVTHDCVLLENDAFWLDAPRISTKNTHGTGDTFSAVITAELAKGASLKMAIILARMFIQGAIKDGIVVGHGHGPTNHWAQPDPGITVRSL